jgi:hypothetical protein
VLRGGKDNITVILVEMLSDELTTRPGRGPALTISDGEEPPRRIWVGFWIGLGLSLLGSVLLIAMGQFQWAGLALATSLISLGGIAIQMLGPLRDGGFRLARGSALGRAPYATTAAGSRTQFVESLQSLVSEASVAARNREWELEEPPSDSRDPSETRFSGQPSQDQLFQLQRQTAHLANLCRRHLRQFTITGDDDWSPPMMDVSDTPD